MTQRYFITIAYKGINYYGWQKQPGLPTIQNCLEKAFAQINQPVQLVGSSRTDTHVHAQGQIAHLDLPPVQNLDKLLYQLNAVLPSTIVIKNITPVHNTTHARYQAYSRTYQYRIINQPDPFFIETAYYIQGNLDIATMNKASLSLLGKQNHKSFCKAKSPVKHHICHITQAYWTQENHHYIFHITANRFLQSMVRTLTGTLVDIGTQKTDPKKIQDIITAQNRTQAGKNFPHMDSALCKWSIRPIAIRCLLRIRETI